MNSVTLTAPAKVNLFLKVLNKRPDGYHNLSTIFERITLADVITISKRPEGIVISSDKFITRDPKDNLVYKAAALILRYAKIKKGLKRENRGVKIRVTKRIPIAAGLGGGSSDAASVLIGINKLFNMKLKQPELIKLGKKLGADVSFFLLNTPFASGRSRGDVLRKIDRSLKLWHIIVYPGFKLATKDVYEAFDVQPKDLTTFRRNAKITRSFTGSFDYRSLESMLHNDLQNIAITKKAILGSIIERLASQLGRKAIVSGSGPSVFCLYGKRKEAMAGRKAFLAKLPVAERKRWQVFVAGTLT